MVSNTVYTFKLSSPSFYYCLNWNAELRRTHRFVLDNLSITLHHDPAFVLAPSSAAYNTGVYGRTH